MKCQLRSGSARHRAVHCSLGPLAVAAVALVVLMLPATAVGAQAAVDEYASQLPGDAGGVLGSQGGSGGGDGFGDGVSGAADGGGGTAAEAAVGGGGTLPFTGYPLTDLILLLLVLLATGLLLRCLLWLRRRHRTVG